MFHVLDHSSINKQGLPAKLRPRSLRSLGPAELMGTAVLRMRCSEWIQKDGIALLELRPSSAGHN